VTEVRVRPDGRGGAAISGRRRCARGGLRQHYTRKRKGGNEECALKRSRVVFHTPYGCPEPRIVPPSALAHSIQFRDYQ
jgi:hypothetical protein